MPRRLTSKLRRFLGSLCQRLAWRLCDPHDAWLVEYRLPDDRVGHPDGKLHSEIVHGPYSMARAKARELHGRILGDHAESIEG